MITLSSSGTHLPYLMEALRRVPGPVLELGMGPNSTPFLHKLSHPWERADGDAQPSEQPSLWGRPVVSLENDVTWAAQYAWMDGFMHRVIPTDDYVRTIREYGRVGVAEELAAYRWQYWVRWGVVLVDGSPGATRAPCIAALKGKADVFVCHDAEDDTCYGYQRVLQDYRYVRTWKDFPQWTTLASAVVDVTQWAIPLTDYIQPGPR